MKARIKKRWAILCLVAIVGTALVADYLMGTAPQKGLPSIALGSSRLLYLERGFTVFLLVLFIAIVIVEAVSGRFPKSISLLGGSSVTYADTEARVAKTAIQTETLAGTVETAILHLQLELKRLESLVIKTNLKPPP
jgi:hypothetical protein